MDTGILKNLLQHVSLVSKKHHELAEATGEGFNIFRVLGVESSEVQMHSNFLAELLNPKGCHGQKETFLAQFLISAKIEDFDLTNATVVAEKFVGPVNEDYSEGGRIDIVIDDNRGRGIIIENKIYAGDQNNQLLRYYNYAQAHFSKGFTILYLTLNGKLAGKKSTGIGADDSVQYRSISYKLEIKNWIEQCRKEATGHSLLRETLTQYLNLINFLTGQTLNARMESQIADLLIANKENIQAAYILRNSQGIFDKMERQLLDKLKSELQVVGASLGLIPKFDPNFGKTENETELCFMLNNHDLAICFGFESWRMQFSVGLWGGENLDQNLVSLIKRLQLESRIGATSCKNGNFDKWYFLHYFTDSRLRTWDNPEVWMQIQDGNLVAEFRGYIEIFLDELQTINIGPIGVELVSD